MYEVIFLSSSLLLVTPFFFIIIRACLKEKDEYIPPLSLHTPPLNLKRVMEAQETHEAHEAQLP